MIFILIEAIVFLVIMWFALTQIAIPAMNNRPWFPMFKPEAKLKETLAELEQEEYEAGLAKEVEVKKTHLNNMKSEG